MGRRQLYYWGARTALTPCRPRSAGTARGHPAWPRAVPSHLRTSVTDDVNLAMRASAAADSGRKSKIGNACTVSL